MSFDKCQKCGDLVNTDNEPEAYNIDCSSGKTLALEFALCDACKTDIQDMADNYAEKKMQELLVNLVR